MEMGEKWDVAKRQEPLQIVEKRKKIGPQGKWTHNGKGIEFGIESQKRPREKLELTLRVGPRSFKPPIGTERNTGGGGAENKIKLGPEGNRQTKK